jgi:hypothetical protein
LSYSTHHRESCVIPLGEVGQPGTGVEGGGQHRASLGQQALRTFDLLALGDVTADLRNGLGSAAILVPHGPAAGHHQGRTVAPGMDEFTLPVARTQNLGFDRLPRLWKLGV